MQFTERLNNDSFVIELSFYNMEIL